MRKDAEANRDRLVQAGKRAMQDEGGDLPVDRLCEMAGVTRATFYRNFTDRASLYEAVLEHELADMIVALDRQADDPMAFIKLFATMLMVFDRFLATLPDMADYPEEARNEDRIVAVIAPHLARAKEAGLILAHIDGDDILLGCRMIAANWRHDRQPTLEAAMERRLTLLLGGIGTRPGTTQVADLPQSVSRGDSTGSRDDSVPATIRRSSGSGNRDRRS